MVTVEVWVLVDADGGFVASHDDGLLTELCDEHIGGDAGLARRLICCKLEVAFDPVVLTGTVPAEKGGCLTVSQG